MATIKASIGEIGAVILILLCIFSAFYSREVPDHMRKAALDPFTGTILAPLLKPRVPGTAGSANARHHIITHLENAGWSTSTHKFEAKTPHGIVPMVNILAHRPGSFGSKQPKLTLAAHYDSKKSTDGFVGATDSAFPCALLVYLAMLNKPVKTDFDLIFFDGEEAFEEWSAEDSIYGARALAAWQEKEGILPQTLVLLDLLGNKPSNPVPSWFPNTHYLHKQLARINPRLVGGKHYHQYSGMMQDDHLPYLERGVSVLHLIPWEFPHFWHTSNDDANFLHWETMEDWAKLFEKWLF